MSISLFHETDLTVNKLSGHRYISEIASSKMLCGYRHIMKHCTPNCNAISYSLPRQAGIAIKGTFLLRFDRVKGEGKKMPSIFSVPIKTSAAYCFGRRLCICNYEACVRRTSLYPKDIVLAGRMLVTSKSTSC